jgi:hypothetical protein
MRYLTRQTVALRALGRYIDMRSRRIGGGICVVVAHGGLMNLPMYEMLAVYVAPIFNIYRTDDGNKSYA